MTIAEKVNYYKGLSRRQELSISQQDDFNGVYYGSGEDTFADMLPEVSSIRDILKKQIERT